MSVKTVSDADTGDATHVGGADWNKIARYLNGTLNVISPTINSNTSFLDTKMRLQGSSGSNVATIRTNTLSGASDLIIPNPTGSTSSTILTNNSTDFITNKTIPAWGNTVGGFTLQPGTKKMGQIPCGAVTGGGSGVGLLYGFIDMPGLPIRGQDTAFGSYWRYATGTTANTNAGIRVPARWCLKEWLPFFRAKTKVGTFTGTRQYVGLSFDTQIPASDTPIDNNESAVLVGWRSTDSNIQVFRNSGTSSSTSTPTVVDTGIARGTAVRQYEISFPSATTCRVRILDGNATTALYTSSLFSSNLPAADMSPSVVYSSTGTTSRDYDIFFVEMEQNL